MIVLIVQNNPPGVVDQAGYFVGKFLYQMNLLENYRRQTLTNPYPKTGKLAVWFIWYNKPTQKLI